MQMGGIFQRKLDYLDLHNSSKQQASSYFGLSDTVVAWLVWKGLQFEILNIAVHNSVFGHLWKIHKNNFCIHICLWDIKEEC